jgi:homotetrameric cytidine deaminase
MPRRYHGAGPRLNRLAGQGGGSGVTPLGRDIEPLARAARAALERAHAPYSRFPVGAALEVEGNGVVPGCNLENASLGLGMCAERVALSAAWARGLRPGRRLLIVTTAEDPTPPCGACRDAIRRLAPRTEVISVSANGRWQRWLPGDLLPAAPFEPAKPRLNPRASIARKRDGVALDTGEIEALVRGLVSGEVEPYQMAAFMMAVYLRGMDRRETCDLTRAMLASGAHLDLGSLPGPKIDKHSTGGVGDKVSIPLVPLAMSAGIRVPMISGRALGHTGGTLDKLDAIPGYRTRLPIGDLVALARDPGAFIAGQTGELVPADRIMYALRDVSATIESVPLIVSSILSKKLAAGLTGLVLDVKVGRAAFMPDRARAEDLARALVAVAGELGLPAVALLTRMEEPIGRCVGNALEVRESLLLLRDGDHESDLARLTLALGGLMAVLAGQVETMRAGVRLLEERLRTGEAAASCRRWLAAQGGDAGAVDDPERIVVSALRRTLSAQRDGWVAAIDGRLAGDLCVDLGGGRRRMEDPIDPRVGLEFHCRPGDAVRAGDPLVTLFLPDGAAEDRPVAGEERLVLVSDAPPAREPLLLALVTPQGVFDDPWDVPCG